MKALIILLMHLSFNFAYAENRLVYFGGGQSENKNDNMFDYGLKTYLNYTSQNIDWKSEYYYRKTLPKDIDQEQAKNIKPFTPDSFKTKIKSLVSDIESGKIKSGEQLLIHIDTHGTLEEGIYKIATDKGYFSPESLQELIQAAETKNIKLGIIGATCYSGSLMKYKSPNVCIISASQADRVAYGDITDLMVYKTTKNKNKPKNLEELYLQGRAYSSDNEKISQPMISTDAGTQVDEYLTPFKTGIIDGTDLKPELEKPACRNFALGLEDFKENFRQIQAVTKYSVFNKEVFKSERNYANSLQKNLEEYSRLYEKTRAYFTAGKQEKCLNVNKGWPGCFPLFELDKFLSQTAAEHRTHCRKSRKAEEKAQCTDHLQQARDLEDALLLDSDYQKYMDLKKRADVDLQKMKQLSIQMTKDENQLYQYLYKEASQKSKAANPCRDFKL